MDLATITMDKAEAREAFLVYREAVREARPGFDLDADKALAECYRHLARGHRILNLVDAIRAGGEDEDFRPRLAVARADERFINLWRRMDGSALFTAPGSRRRVLKHRTRSFALPPGTLTRIDRSIPQWEAMVPIIPPALRPSNPMNYVMLWEAEWRPGTAPVDPALLRPLGGGYYAVVAVWDLTPLEQSVLGHIRR